MSLKDLGISKQEAWIVLVLGFGLAVGFVARPLDEYLFPRDRAALAMAVAESEKQFNAKSLRIKESASNTEGVVAGEDPAPVRRHAPETLISKPVDLNTATSVELQQIPGIGPKTAERIIEYRRKFGPFSSVEDLLKVKGIGKKTLEKINPFIEIIY